MRALAAAGVARNADWATYTQNINGVQMALVPAGCFQMGSTDGDGNEQPVHEVCFDTPFWIDMYEVTNVQTGGASPECAQYSSDDNQPRVCINWIEVKSYCASRGARLPTEAEWEYAARGPDGLVYPWGNEWNSDLAVWNADQAAEVGSKPGGASWVGALDLSGNVWEWVSDWYGSYSSGRQVNPQGPAAGEYSDYRVLRGGSWVSLGSYYLRAALRDGSGPDLRFNYFGFRCALSYSP